jgi:hypothetical protein
LEARWDRLVAEANTTQKETLFHPHIRKGTLGDKYVGKVVSDGLGGHESRSIPVSKDQNKVITPTRYGFRSFDRQWIIPDNRLLNQPNPTLWVAHSDQQIYLTVPHDRTPTNGPALTITSLIPDLHHYAGRGGRVFPLWADTAATQSNVQLDKLPVLYKAYGTPIAAEDLFAYIAAVASQPRYTARFAADLVQPGLRIPITADPALFAEAAKLGREVVWLHTFGERFVAPAEERPRRAPRLPESDRPHVPAEGAIPPDASAMPEIMTYNAVTRRLHVGAGYVDNVSPKVWAYEVSGKHVLTHWFSYRGRDRSRPMIGDRRPPSPLGDIQPEGWLSEYTTELLNVLNVLGRLVALEPRQADLLDRICAGATISIDDLRAAMEDVPKPRSGTSRRRQTRNQGELLG